MRRQGRGHAGACGNGPPACCAAAHGAQGQVPCRHAPAGTPRRRHSAPGGGGGRAGLTYRGPVRGELASHTAALCGASTLAPRCRPAGLRAPAQLPRLASHPPRCCPPLLFRGPRLDAAAVGGDGREESRPPRGRVPTCGGSGGAVRLYVAERATGHGRGGGCRQGTGKKVKGVGPTAPGQGRRRPAQQGARKKDKGAVPGA